MSTDTHISYVLFLAWKVVAPGSSVRLELRGEAEMVKTFAHQAKRKKSMGWDESKQMWVEGMRWLFLLRDEQGTSAVGQLVNWGGSGETHQAGEGSGGVY